MRIPSHIHTTIDTLNNEPNIDLFLIRSDRLPTRFFARLSTGICQAGIYGWASACLFAWVAKLEGRFFLGVFPDRFKAQLGSQKIDEEIFSAVVTTTPVLSDDRRNLHYGDNDLEKVRALNLHLLIDARAQGVFPGELPGTTDHGLLAFDDDNRAGEAGWLPAFREVYSRTPTTGFAIELLMDATGGGTAVLRSGFATQRSFTENLAMLHRVSGGFLCQTISAFARTGEFPHPATGAVRTLSAPKAPTPVETFVYVAKTLALYSTLAVRRLLLRQKQRWSVAFARAPWDALSPSEATIVRNPTGRFLADPFVATKDGKSVIFVEDYSYDRGRGTISAVVLDKDDNYAIVPDVVAEPFHLSFPFLFEYDGDLYMVPESHEANAIRLYRCVAFPDRWAYQHDLMSDVRAADSMLVEQSGRWWLLTNIAPPGCEAFDVQLCAFSADSPLSREWTPHPANPVVLSSTASRNGGLVRDRAGAILRVRQKTGFGQYGESVTLAKIARLDRSAYEETFHRAFLPDFLPGLKGTHHMHSDGTITVFDFVREERTD